MWNYRLASLRSSTLLKQYRVPRPSLHYELTLNRNLWSGNKRPNLLFSALATRLLRAFDRNLKSIFKFGRCTRNSVFGTLLENRLIQVMLVDFGRTFTKSRDMLFSATCLSVYNWEKNALPDEHLEELVNDVDFISRLTLETLTCKSCNKRLQIDQKIPDIVYCSCSEKTPLCREVDGWKPFIERPNTLVWRKEHEEYKGLFSYKMYGRLEKVTAMDFLRVQLDTNFRKQWDSSATELKIIEENQETNSDLVYWEMRWPKPFANRDYVFERKLSFIPTKNVCIISSMSTSHPALPVNKSMHRVTEYWSYMVVKPFKDFEKPGVEFVLTYFDNPGLSIPSSVSTWVAMTGLPSFVSKLQEAAARVGDLAESEPTLMQCLRAQMETNGGTTLRAIETEESFTVQLPTDSATMSAGQEPVTIEEERSTLTIVEGGPTSTEGQDQISVPSSPSPGPLIELSTSSVNADPVSQESNDFSEATAVKMTSNVPSNPNSCSENTQFLARSSPVYA